jgi:uncharacterized coiled-coil DUF342 family protein
MSDEPTKNIEEKYDTKPTIETVLERINALGEELRSEMHAGFAQVEKRFDEADARFDGLDRRLTLVEDKISVLNEDVLELRADVRGLKSSLKVHEPR